MNTEETLLNWLNDARAMEVGQIADLVAHTKAAEVHPELSRRLQQHLDATRRHAELVEGCIVRCGGKPAVAPTSEMKTERSHTGKAELSSAEPLKLVLCDYAHEYYEIACYTALIEGAMHSGHGELIPTLEEILEEEEDMAAWIEDQLPRLVEAFMQHPAHV